ncbi:hypothetical protein [Exiguobacterium sp. RIT341]|uniref:hypothetical protein n=1 Tax=Exiguobacterium sp. RIT341 TaxID=1470592 RepID=UPI00044CE8C7|nr:hypothetical protein [Exiguobacterium sp. RIT341]EZP61330.1 hypothetical protein BW42_01001 [Exiguobacterium sp. RIT341]
MNRLKQLQIVLLVLITICAFFFWAGHGFEVSSHQISGNGNPGILFAYIIVFLFPLIVLGIIVLFYLIDARPLSLMTTIILAAIYTYIGYFHQRESYVTYQHLKRQQMIDAGLALDYIDDVLVEFSIYLNSQFFNLNTFLIYICLVLMTASALYLLLSTMIRLIQIIRFR